MIPREHRPATLPPRLFITGTDTDVGKTVVAAILTLGLDAVYWKPLQSGLQDVTDTEWVRQATGLSDDHFAAETYRLAQPLSPHTSAALEGVEIELERFCLPALAVAPRLVVEGAGGILVPLGQRHTMLDLMQRFSLPVLLVARSTLGTINHTLLSIEQLRQRGLAIAGVVMNGPKNPANKEAIEHFGQVAVVAEVEPLDDLTPASLSAVFERCFAGLAVPSEESQEEPQSPSNVWSPYTQMKTAPIPQRVRAGRGALLELEDGRQVVDCISSWWVTLHGHAQAEIAAAIARQAQQLEQVIPAGFTHEPAEVLAQRLVNKLPDSLRWIFYSDNGSTAVEVALKMAFQFWKNSGVEGRQRFLCFAGAYHGDTLGAMSVGARSLFTQPFGEWLFAVDTVPFPATHIGEAQTEAEETRALETLEALLERNTEGYAAMILEPLVQGAGGMRMCRPHFLRQMETLLRRYDVLVIYDEVLTGFGRTGEWFACTKASTAPDIVCLAKGITGGFMPLAATACSAEIYAAFYSDDPHKALYHGHSYSANPLGCAAALASLDLLEQDEDRFRRLEAWHREELAALGGHPRLQRLRVCGTIAALDVVVAAGEGYLHSVGPVLKERFLERGFLLRPLGNVIYVIPPYCIERQQLRSIYDCIGEVVEEL